MNIQDIKQLLENKDYINLKAKLSKMNEVDLAEMLKPLDDHTTLIIFRLLPKDLAVEVFAHFTADKQLEILNLITDKELTGIIDELFFDDFVDLIEEMPANIVTKILNHAKQDERKLINQFLKYPAHSAGSLMTIEYVELRKNMSVKEAMAHIKKTGMSSETVYTCYVTNSDRVLEGIVSLRALVTSDENLILEDIMEAEIIQIGTHDDQEEVAGLFQKYGFLALPVVDKENRLTGIITIDDIMEVIEQEATEDFQKMAAMSPSEDEYLETSVWDLSKNRLPWLLILMISATFTGRIMGKYEDILTSIAILGTFVPMLMDTGGNAGSQSSTLIIRGLAVGNIETKDGLKILWKEFRISFTVGVILALTNFVRLIVLEKIDVVMAFIVSITLLITVILSKIVGGVLPIIAKRLKMDPAIMAGPLITTIVDALSLMVYFGVASTLLSI